MKFEELDYQLLARYMAGECSESELHKIEEWAEADPENKDKLLQFSRIWHISKQNKLMSKELFDAEEQWQQLQGRLQRDEVRDYQPENRADEGVFSKKARSASIHSMTQKITRVAAIILVAGLIGLLAYQNMEQPQSTAKEPVLREVSTANAQRANLTLGDGTNVMLNSGSTVKFPEQFEADIREVFLEGEAYFDVVSNPERPFLIHSRGSVIEVLGTSFSVRSYEEDDQVRVVVEEGSVSFKTDQAGSGERTVVEANELGKYQLGSNGIEVASIEDMELYLSWRDGYLKFREASMSEVATSLERRYGVEVLFEDTGIQEKALTASLKSRSIRNVLDVISVSLDIDYQLEDDEVTFYNTN